MSPRSSALAATESNNARRRRRRPRMPSRRREPQPHTSAAHARALGMSRSTSTGFGKQGIPAGAMSGAEVDTHTGTFWPAGRSDRCFNTSNPFILGMSKSRITSRFNPQARLNYAAHLRRSTLPCTPYSLGRFMRGPTPPIMRRCEPFSRARERRGAHA
jgi:hypothetical protein